MQNPLTLTVGLALLIQAASSAPPSPGQTGVFEVHAEVSPASPGAKAWQMKEPGGSTEIVYLDPAALLDASAVATADVEPVRMDPPTVRPGLTPAGAQRLAKAASRLTGGRIGVVAAGRLRAAPYVTRVPAGGVFVIAGGLTDADAADIARSLGPPARPIAGGAAPRSGGAAIAELQRRWRVVEASMNGRPIQDPKIVALSWNFRGAEVTLTNGQGHSEMFALLAEGPGVLRLEPVWSFAGEGRLDPLVTRQRGSRRRVSRQSRWTARRISATPEEDRGAVAAGGAAMTRTVRRLNRPRR